MKFAETVGGTEVVLGNVVTGKPLTGTTLATMERDPSFLWNKVNDQCDNLAVDRRRYCQHSTIAFDGSPVYHAQRPSKLSRQQAVTIDVP